MSGGIIRFFGDMTVDARHGLYVWWLTLACLTGIFALSGFSLWSGRETVLSTNAVGALSNVLITVVCSYLGIELVGRSQILNKIGDRITTPPQAVTSATTTASDGSSTSKTTGYPNAISPTVP